MSIPEKIRILEYRNSASRPVKRDKIKGAELSVRDAGPPHAVAPIDHSVRLLTGKRVPADMARLPTRSHLVSGRSPCAELFR
jgi:hypothetical protein